MSIAVEYTITQDILDKLNAVSINPEDYKTDDSFDSEAYTRDSTDAYMLAMAEGIKTYIERYTVDVKTNGLITIAITPPATSPVVNEPVDGTLTIRPAEDLKNALKSGMAATAGIPYTPPANTLPILNMTQFFAIIFSWLPVPITLLPTLPNGAASPLSTVTGAGTISWVGFIPPTLGAACANELANATWTELKDVGGGEQAEMALSKEDALTQAWNIIGKWIYNGLKVNITNVPGVIGTANPTVVPNGTVYTATLTTGIIEFPE